eukprot:gene4979-5221_t
MIKALGKGDVRLQTLAAAAAIHWEEQHLTLLLANRYKLRMADQLPPNIRHLEVHMASNLQPLLALRLVDKGCEWVALNWGMVMSAMRPLTQLKVLTLDSAWDKNDSSDFEGNTFRGLSHLTFLPSLSLVKSTITDGGEVEIVAHGMPGLRSLSLQGIRNVTDVSCAGTISSSLCCLTSLNLRTTRVTRGGIDQTLLAGLPDLVVVN